MPTARVRDLDVYYEIHGSGPRVVLISGTGGDLRQNPQRGQGLLEQHHEVLMYDQRGLGQTTKPDRPYTMEDYADDAAGLLDVVGWDRAHVVGISFGGMVAQHLALRHPDRVDRLVLACTSSGGAGGSSFDLLALDDLPPEERYRVILPIMDARNDVSVDPPVLAPRFEFFLQHFAAPAGSSPDEESARGARRQLEARAGHDVFDRLGQIGAPCLVIGGIHDRQAPVENLEHLAGAIPGARLELCDGGHLFLFQDPAAWPYIVDFLAETAHAPAT